MAPIESINAWIDRQDWSDAMKQQAHELVAERNRIGLNPMTGSAWKRWADEQIERETWGKAVSITLAQQED